MIYGYCIDINFNNIFLYIFHHNTPEPASQLVCWNWTNFNYTDTSRLSVFNIIKLCFCFLILFGINKLTKFKTLGIGMLASLLELCYSISNRKKSERRNREKNPICSINYSFREYLSEAKNLFLHSMKWWCTLKRTVNIEKFSI